MSYASERNFHKIPWHRVLVFFFLSIVIGTAGYIYHENQQSHIKQEIQKELSAIADLKVVQIENWRKERLEDAAMISKNPFIAYNVEQFLKNPLSTGVKKELLEWMVTFKKHHQYKSAFLLDPKGTVRLSVTDVKEVIEPYIKELAAEAMRKKKEIFSDLYQSKTLNDIRFSLLVPLLISEGRDTLPVGVLLLQIDPNQFLYPLIQSWPTKSRTAETLLVRREGTNVVFLNRLRHRNDTPLTLRFPISEQRLLEDMTVHGKKGIVEGVDYRGESVVAVLRPVHDSTWFLIAKEDFEEAYKLIHRGNWFIAAIMVLSILVSCLGVGLIWRHRSALSYRREYELEHERRAIAQRYEYLSRYANDIILLLDQDLRIIEANERAVETYGYTLDELLHMSLKDLQAPETQSVLSAQMEKVRELKGMVFESLHQRKDETRFPVENSSRIVEINGNEFYQCIIRDITERKQAEKVLQSRAEFEKLITSFSTKFINLSSHEIDSGILHALQTIGKFIGADRSYIFLFDENEDKMISKYEWCAEGIKPHVQTLQGMSVEEFLWLIVKINRFENIHIPSVADLFPEGSVEKEILQSQSIQSLIAVPMVSGNFLIGFLEFDSVKMEKIWSTDIITLLRIVGEIFTNALNRKQAEEALRKSEERYQTILNTAGEGICEIDLEGKVTFINPAGAKMCGYEVHELIGKHLHNTLHYAKPDGSPYSEEECPHYGSLVQGITIEIGDELFWRKDGTSFPITCISTPVRVQDMITGAVVAFRNITARKKAEEALRESEERNQTILNTAGVGICEIDLEGKVIFINPAGAKMCGYGVHELIGKHLHNTLHYVKPDGSPYPEEECPFYASLTQGITAEVVNELFWRKDGTSFPVMCISTPVRVQDMITGAVLTFRDRTERKKVEEALWESEQRVKNILHGSPIPAFVIDKYHNVLFWNEALEQLSGIEADVMIGTSHHWKAFYNEERPCMIDLLIDNRIDMIPQWYRRKYVQSKVLEDSYEATDFFPSLGEGGKWLHFTAAVIRDSAGNIVCGLETLEDITERKRAEESLIFLKEAIETLPIGIIISDMKGKILYANPDVARMHGYKVENLIGSDARILVPRKYLKPLLFEQIMGSEIGVWKRESYNIKESGETFPVQLTSITVKNTEGVPIGTVVACEDITERKQSEEKLIQRQEALYSVYKMATTLGTSLKTLCNNVLVSLSRLLQTSNVIAQQHENGNVKVISYILDRKLGSEEVTCPSNFQCLSGYDTNEGCLPKCSLGNVFKKYQNMKDILKSSLRIPMLDSSGNIIGAITVINTKERIFTEDEIRLIKIFAQHVAFEIERNVMETRLRNAQKMEVIGTLAGGVAHEVRNPLNAIIIIAESLVKELGESPEYQLLLTHIRSQVDRLSVLMKDLLDLGKSIDPSDLRGVSLSEVCSATVSLWKHSVCSRTHKIKLLKSPECDDIFVLADSRRLQQVFLNLLENAAQHDREGNEILFVVKESEGSRCIIQVVDRGTGVPEELLSRIFEPFFSTRRGGTGLGLTIVKYIVETHGGNIVFFNNKPLPGCTVEVKLPIYKQQSHEAKDTIS
ncbi:MAG: PAS domain S-box protein [Nitrospira sp.]|nr:PAS domain S-box protein [Nitrospira sp.]